MDGTRQGSAARADSGAVLVSFELQPTMANAEPKSARDNSAVFLFNILSFPFTSYKIAKPNFALPIFVKSENFYTRTEL